MIINKIRLSFLALVVILAASAASPGQTKRVKFRRGDVSAEAAGMLSSYLTVRTYIVRVREGQTLHLEQVGVDGGLITIKVIDPNGDPAGDADASCNNRREISQTIRGDYVIEVSECRKADPWRGRFTFRVTVR